jgi:hypothetical protein
LASRIEHYRQMLLSTPEAGWEQLLLSESGLPGPRGNLELAQAVSELGHSELFWHYSRHSPEEAPVNNPKEFLVFCGILGFGRQAAEGNGEILTEIKLFASDPRWRVREAVAMALQTIGKCNFRKLIEISKYWCAGNLYEKRAVIAGLAEPALLASPEFSQPVFAIFDRVTGGLITAEHRNSEEFRVLRLALAYAWSVVVAAWPDEGKVHMEYWLQSDDKNIRWVMKQNLSKKRLARVDQQWVSGWQRRLP